MSRLIRRASGPHRPRRFSAPEAAMSSNVEGSAGGYDQQLIKSLSRMTAEQAKGKTPGGGKEEVNALGEEGSLQREMLKDPRFGSPLLCDTLVLLLALVPLFCGFTAYFSDTEQEKNASSGYNYGLALCGIFIFLLGLRSASLHLINRTDTTEDRVLYILDKFGGSVCIPKVPEVLHLEAGASPGPTLLATQPGASGTEETSCRLVLDPVSSSVFLLSNARQTGASGNSPVGQGGGGGGSEASDIAMPLPVTGPVRV